MEFDRQGAKSEPLRGCYRENQLTFLEMFRRMPIPARVKKRLVPPEEMKGRGIPLVGRRERTTLMLKKAWSRMAVVMPKAVRRANGSVERKAVRRPRYAEDDEEGEDEDGADEAQFFSDVGEDEVGVGLGEIEELLHALHVAAAGEAAGADGDEGLVDVESGALKVGVGVEEDEHALATPGNPEEEHAKRRAGMHQRQGRGISTPCRRG